MSLVSVDPEPTEQSTHSILVAGSMIDIALRSEVDVATQRVGAHQPQ